MMEEQVLDLYRQEGTLVRIVRDMLKMNDIIGWVVAWDEEQVMIRKRNRRIVKLSRTYSIQPSSEPRLELELLDSEQESQ
ncbi:hypothetical protein M3650_17240 [Paenibacillus sp. MER TA 81-3]|uniref:hypothetical protein n=1 Tax=Paenibacillus sp. MER TA 81-3 TaxID=2939573 RepID=UPI002040EF60|nr:hypothetical protein [Paenibacillus sp. MER TA 81-3]MCM3340335.1 hypothetical protein [Paenibacillus sp. MER TA 81-3]